MLRDTFWTAQAERGTGEWADADPEVYVGSDIIGRLARGADSEGLVQQAMGQFRANIELVKLRKYFLTVQAVNNLPQPLREDTAGVYLFFRPRKEDDPPHRPVWDGLICLRVARTRGQLLGPTLFEAAKGGGGCEATQRHRAHGA